MMVVPIHLVINACGVEHKKIFQALCHYMPLLYGQKVLLKSINIARKERMPKLELDDQHRYTLDGRRLISVTQALSILDDRWKVDPFYLERGRLIHLATEYYDNDELDESTVDERIAPYLSAYIKFVKDTAFSPTFVEHQLYHPQFFYAGKIDRIGIWLNTDQHIIDLKSGAKTDVDKLQGAAYWELCLANKIPIKKTFDLYLKDDGNYSLVEVEKPKLLLPVFLAALTCARFKEGL